MLHCWRSRRVFSRPFSKMRLKMSFLGQNLRNFLSFADFYLKNSNGTGTYLDFRQLCKCTFIYCDCLDILNKYGLCAAEFSQSSLLFHRKCTLMNHCCVVFKLCIDLIRYKNKFILLWRCGKDNWARREKRYGKFSSLASAFYPGIMVKNFWPGKFGQFSMSSRNLMGMSLYQHFINFQTRFSDFS